MEIWDLIILALSMKFTKQSLDGVGALKGAPCVVRSITDGADGTHTVTFEWTDENDVKHTSEMVVNDGPQGEAGVGYSPQIGQVETLEPNAEATVDVELDDEEKIATFNFGIPRGSGGIAEIPSISSEELAAMWFADEDNYLLTDNEEILTTESQEYIELDTAV